MQKTFLALLSSHLIHTVILPGSSYSPKIVTKRVLLTQCHLATSRCSLTSLNTTHSSSHCTTHIFLPVVSVLPSCKNLLPLQNTEIYSGDNLIQDGRVFFILVTASPTIILVSEYNPRIQPVGDWQRSTWGKLLATVRFHLFHVGEGSNSMYL